MILISGATGTVGIELVHQLLDLGQPVRVFVRDAGKVAYLGNRVECAIGDLVQLDTLEAAMVGVERMFLLDLSPQHMTNTLEAARRTDLKHIVKLSAYEAAEHKTSIGRWHYEREEMLRSSGLAWTLLRPGQFMANSLHWAGTIAQQGVVYSAAGDGKVAPIDTADIAAVAAVALTQPGHAGQAYMLTGPTLTTAREQVQTLAQVLGKPIKLVDISPADETRQMLERGMPPFFADALGELTQMLRSGEGAYLTQTVQQVTGRTPRTFETWCRNHMAAFQRETQQPWR